jgi:hypothetical protein
MKIKAIAAFLVLLALLLGACNLPAGTENRQPVVGETATSQATDIPSSATPLPATETTAPTETPLPPTETVPPTATQTDTPLPTETPVPPTATFTKTFTPIPTYIVLRGRVLPERANCRYGPGAAYLYKYGLVGGSNLEIIGRNQLGTWVLIQAIGGDNPCWVKAELMEFKADVLNLEPVDPHIVQAWSPYYSPLTNVSAVRDKNQPSKVTVFWSPLVLRAGDDAEQVPYVVEAWVCQEGEIVFVPVGAYQTAAEVIDEPGCDEPSHGRVLAAEKHGYTAPVEIPWP